MDDNTEHHIALREAHQIGASDSFFAARKELRDTEHERYIFDAGFRRGFDCHESLQRKATATHPAHAALADALEDMAYAGKYVLSMREQEVLNRASAALRARVVANGVIDVDETFIYDAGRQMYTPLVKVYFEPGEDVAQTWVARDSFAKQLRAVLAARKEVGK